MTLLFVASCSSSIPDAETEQTLAFAFYNVENLFDTVDDPAVDGDGEYTPTGRMKWTEQRLARKYSGIARAMRMMDSGRGPDVIGLCEVENRGVLERLVKDYLPQGMYGIVHADSPDERGIDVAILYRVAKMKLAGMKSHTIDLGSGEPPVRDIMEAVFTKEGKEFTVLVNHWPSRNGGEDKTEPRRLKAAAVAVSIIDSIYSRNTAADIVVMGDFNDEPTNRSIASVLQAVEPGPFAEETGFVGRMQNAAARAMKHDTVGTYYYDGRWLMLDQIMFSRGVYDNDGLTVYNNTLKVFHPDFLRDFHESRPAHPPYRTYIRGNLYIGGVSDHFPVYITVGWR